MDYGKKHLTSYRYEHTSYSTCVEGWSWTGISLDVSIQIYYRHTHTHACTYTCIHTIFLTFSLSTHGHYTDFNAELFHVIYRHVLHALFGTDFKRRCLLCQPPEEVSCVAWNRQVQHILASNFAARCVVWDLRKNEPIIKISDSMSQVSLGVVPVCSLFVQWLSSELIVLYYSRNRGREVLPWQKRKVELEATDCLLHPSSKTFSGSAVMDIQEANDLVHSLVIQAPVTGGTHLRRSEVLRSLRVRHSISSPWKPRTSHHLSPAGGRLVFDLAGPCDSFVTALPTADNPPKKTKKMV